MKKAILKFVSVMMLLLIVAAGLGACGNSTSGSQSASGASGTTSSQAAGSAPGSVAGGTEQTGGGQGQWKVGINYFSSVYPLLALARTSEQATLAAGGTSMKIDDGVSMEQIVADFENMIQNGCDGLIVWCPVETIVMTIAQMCEEHKVPFVLSDKVPTNPEIIEALYANPYFVGAVAPANGEYGAYAAQMCLDEGYTKAIVSTPGVGDATGTPRAEGFVAAFEAGGGKILTIVNNDGMTDGGQANVEDALIAYPDVEVIFGTGSEFGVGAVEAVKNNGGAVKVITCDLDETLLNQLNDGILLGLVGDYWVAGFFSGVLLQNYLDGHPLTEADGKPVWVEDLMYFGVNGDQLDLYKKFWISEYCYSPEEINQMFVANNPDFTTADLKEIMYAYSLNERLNAKLAEGKVTEAELTAAGVLIS